MRIAEIAGTVPAGSGAVSRLSDRPGDVESTIGRSTPATSLGPGTRISETATRTTTTRTTSFVPAPSADEPDAAHAEYSLSDLVAAYLDCRRTKRNSPSALAFEINLERNLIALHEELLAGSYRPGRSICFGIRRPKPREVWAAAFRDRVVHHLLYNRVAPRFEHSFIADSCACIKGRGTLYAARRLEAKVRSISENWRRPIRYLKGDLANFFVTINKHRLQELLDARIPEPWWRNLARLILWHDPRTDVEVRGDPGRLALIPPHKSLFNQPPHLGLPIGNLSSQFFANVYLNPLDQFVKHELRAKHYIRYVDDFVLLHESAQQLNAWMAAIEAFLPERLGIRVNPAKTVRQPIAHGIDFVGHVIKPWRTTIRRRTFNDALSRIEQLDAADVHQSANSYFGLLRQANSHHDRARLANLVRSRGLAVDMALTKAYR